MSLPYVHSVVIPPVVIPSKLAEWVHSAGLQSRQHHKALRHVRGPVPAEGCLSSAYIGKRASKWKCFTESESWKLQARTLREVDMVGHLWEKLVARWVRCQLNDPFGTGRVWLDYSPFISENGWSDYDSSRSSYLDQAMKPICISSSRLLWV